MKVHRLNGPAVYIGYIFLMPSLAGIALCLAFLLASWVGAFTYHSVSPATLEGLKDTHVPAELQQSLRAGEPATEAEMAHLTPDQRYHVQHANRDIEAAKLASGCFAACSTGIALIGAGLSFIGGLLGWLLVMRKRVLMCNFCRATVDAS